MTKSRNTFRRGLTMALVAVMGLAPLLSTAALASSHQDAPLIIRDPSANTTDVYAFVSGTGSAKVLNLGLSVYPHEVPNVGPNKYNFDDAVQYDIHVAMGNDSSSKHATKIRKQFCSRI